MANTTNKRVEELFNLGIHLGHKSNRVHPKAKKYIYTIQNGVSIIDLTKTVELLDKAKEFVSKLAKEGGILLLVVTKKTANLDVESLCKKNGIPYITVKWPAGLLTNFDTIAKNIKKLKTMREDKQNGAWEKFVKHEQFALQKDLNRLEKFYGGIADLTKLPDAIFVMDVKKEKNVVKEARMTHTPLVAVVDTNVDPDVIDYRIPGNDDSSSSIEYFVTQIVEAYAAGKK